MKSKYLKYLKKQFGGVINKKQIEADIKANLHEESLNKLNDNIYYQTYKKYFINIKEIINEERKKGKKIMLIIEDPYIVYNQNIIKDFIIPDGYFPIIFYERKIKIIQKSDLNINYNKLSDTPFFFGAVESIEYDPDVKFDLIIFDKITSIDSFNVNSSFIQSIFNLVYDKKSIVLLHQNIFTDRSIYENNDIKSKKIKTNLSESIRFRINYLNLFSYNQYIYPKNIIDKLIVWFNNNFSKNYFSFNKDATISNSTNPESFEFINTCKFIFNLNSEYNNYKIKFVTNILFYNKNIWKNDNDEDNKFDITSDLKYSKLYIYITNIQKNPPSTSDFVEFYNNILAKKQNELLLNYIENIRKKNIIDNKLKIILIIGAVPSEKKFFNLNYNIVNPVYLGMDIVPIYKYSSCVIPQTKCEITIEYIYKKILGMDYSFQDYPFLFNTQNIFVNKNIKFDYIIFNTNNCNKVNFNRDKIIQLCELTYDDSSVIVFDRIDYTINKKITNNQANNDYIKKFADKTNSDLIPIYNIKVEPYYVIPTLITWFNEQFGNNVNINKETYFSNPKNNTINFCDENKFYDIFTRIRNDPDAKPTILFYNYNRYYTEQLQDEYSGIKLYSIYMYLLQPQKLLKIYNK